MKTLHLPLKRKWFDMIESGEKMEEYRDIWAVNDLGEAVPKMWCVSRCCYFAAHGIPYPDDSGHPPYFENDVEWTLDDGYWFPLRSYNTVTFRNGYGKHVPELVCDCTGITIAEGKPEWGADPGKKYFVIGVSNPRRTR